MVGMSGEGVGKNQASGQSLGRWRQRQKQRDESEAIAVIQAREEGARAEFEQESRGDSRVLGLSNQK